jgi:hypothetical protein
MDAGAVPRTGQDNDAIYRQELGLDDRQLAALRVEGSI